MYELTFTGKTPNILVNKVSVVNNSNADIIKMFVQATQQSISLSGYNCYIKFQSKSGLYFNKIKLNTTESEGMIEASWQLSFDYTQYKQLQCQLQFQSDSSDDVIWQSEIFYLNLSSTINVDRRIVDTYPTILNQIEAEITTYAGRFDDIDAEIAGLTEQVIANRKTSVQYDRSENEPERHLNILLTDENRQQYTWAVSHYYDADNNIHYAFFDGFFNCADLLVDSSAKIYALTIFASDTASIDIRNFNMHEQSLMHIEDAYSNIYNLGIDYTTANHNESFSWSLPRESGVIALKETVSALYVHKLKAYEMSVLADDIDMVIITNHKEAATQSTIDEIISTSIKALITYQNTAYVHLAGTLWLNTANNAIVNFNGGFGITSYSSLNKY